MNFRGIYLAGGFHSDWQNTVKKAVKDFMKENFLNDKLNVVFYDPKSKELAKGPKTEEQKQAQDPRVYTQWDLMALDHARIAFVYVEKDNPGIGAILELGYAKAKGLTTILVAERGKTIYKDRYLDMARQTADVCFNTLEEGIEHLQSLLILLTGK